MNEDRTVWLPSPMDKFARDAIDDAFKSVVEQLTKNCIDQTMTNIDIKNGLRNARNGRIKMLEILDEFSAKTK
jgi:hypothetical protein